MDVSMLDNRLQYILEQRKGSGVVAVQIWVKTGSWHERTDIAGITHFIEHLIFKGTEKIKANEMPARIESLGGRINAFTSYDNTVYHIVIPSKAFREGFELLADAVQNPAFPEGEIIKEKKVVLEEIKMGEDDPQRKLFKELFSLSYQGEPYGRPIIGYENTVSSISRQDILSYYKANYTPDNIVIVIVGDFHKEDAVSLIKKYFSQSDSKIKRTDLDNKGKEKTDIKEKIIERNVRENYLAISYNVPSLIHEDIPALEVLSTILGEGDSSRLQEQLKYRKGIVNNISTYLFTPRNEGVFVVYSTYADRDYMFISQEIEEEINRLLKDKITDWELTKAKNIISASYIYSKETVQGKARQIGNYLTLSGDIDFIEKFLKKIEAVNRDDIERVLNKYIIGKEKRLVVLKPKKTSNPYIYRLKNNMRCVVNKNSSSPSFAFRVGFIGGLKDEPSGKNGIFNLMSRMLLKGTLKKDALTIAKEIDMLAGDITPFNGKNIFGLSGKFLSKDLRPVMELLHELLTTTVFSEDEFRKVKEEVLSDIRQKYDDPIGYTFMRFNEFLYKGHPYSKDPDGTEADIKDIRLSEVETLYRDYVTPSRAVIAVSGDIDEKELKSIFQRLFSGWKGRTNSLKKMPFKAEKQDVFIDKDIIQHHLVFGFKGPGILDKDRYPVEVMDAILSGMGGRIHKVLREENPYAYALTFFNRMAYDAGGMGIYIGTDPRFVEDVNRVAKAEIERIINDGFTETEVENSKSRLIGNHLIRMQANRNITTRMCLDTIYGLGADYFKLWQKNIEKVSQADVNRVAKKYLKIDRMVKITVGKKDSSKR